VGPIGRNINYVLQPEASLRELSGARMSRITE
jgi:hypothetical protein